ncbi:dTDP-4-amino-4,6-dideoxygalactose transaminase [candidate division KSB3 bacterium]|uniref:dTDP-4-amino-4,6-dideoxygalactose transaminase n=1 Tax=candidate division KSB3 bacterium TaxID=2044937 RepID=A0A2G6E7K3_9BACT|nr:MAG: dTDP-4-amino-4,6-dideoxygalactose transaminase [candidate division KSB3 bacterium]PIE30435.1 MAG: dTDP-4-amino-4,6-dideoxygalactose transaminase [candidate division KSB3 bacterium]
MVDVYRIPFNKVTLNGQELQYISDALEGGCICGNGMYTKKCQRLFEQLLHVPKAFLTTSCTDALEMAALLLDIQPGDEVIVPSFTFVSTVNAFVLRGAHPIFADIRPDTLNLDESQLELLISARTKAVIPVHYAGVSCEMNTILDIAQGCDLAVIEDNAHGLFGQYRGRFLGTFGCMATQSFHETKNITCGEGGALLLNDPNYIERAEIIREKGTNRSRFFRREVEKYSWVDLGSSYLPSDLLAAFLYAQLTSWKHIQSRRRRIWNCYEEQLSGWAQESGVRLPIVPEYCEQSFHMFYLLMPTAGQRQAMIAHLKAHGIQSVFHYLPLHLSEMGRKFGGKPGDCPITEDISGRLLRLPFYHGLSEDEQAEVIQAVLSFQ